MALFDDAGLIPAAQITNPAKTVGDAAGTMGQIIAEYGGHVEGTIERRSIMNGWVPLRPVRGTNTVQNFAVGEATLGKVTPGTPPDATPAEFGKANLVIDTLIFGRNTFPLLEVFQTSYDARKEVGTEHGKKIAKFFDQAMLIQAAKASMATESKFSNGQGTNKPAGHSGGNVVTLAASGDGLDPAKLYKAVRDLSVKFELKDIVPAQDDLILVTQPAQFYALADAEQIVNGNYKTSDGNTFENIAIYKALGVPVMSSNNLPNTNVTAHLLSNAGNSNAYNGDFTKLVGVMFSARALLAGETIPLNSDVFYDKNYKMWFVDSHLSFGVTVNRAEYAGSIWLP
jgi:hypothetical protein